MLHTITAFRSVNHNYLLMIDKHSNSYVDISLICTAIGLNHHSLAFVLAGLGLKFETRTAHVPYTNKTISLPCIPVTQVDKLLSRIPKHNLSEAAQSTLNAQQSKFLAALKMHLFNNVGFTAFLRSYPQYA